jgi:C1A family cysteine protease
LDCYNGAQSNDEWPGSDYDGSSVRGAFKWLQSQGYVGTYEWAFDINTVANWLLTVGPMVAGTTWFSDMFDPLPSGFLRVSGDAVGGHAYTLVGCNRDKPCPDGTRGAVRIQNSWSASWGQGGLAWISFVDFHKLLREDGECVCAREVKVGR